MKKYELTEETYELNNGVTLHRIKALMDIPGVVKAGELGGWIENEENLSHNRACWVYDDAKVYDNAKVHGNAKVYDNAKVLGNAEVYGHACVFENAKVFGNALVYCTAKVFGNAEVYGDTEVHGNARVYNNAKVCARAKVCDNAKVYDRAMVSDNAEVYGNTEVHGYAYVGGDAEVCLYAKVRGYTRVFGGIITSHYDCVTVGPVGARGDFTTLNLTTGAVCTGCFKGTLCEFEKAVEETHGDNRHGAAYKTLIAYFKTLIKNRNNTI